MAERRFELRPYQAECLEKAKLQNTIVCLPTGTGKTLVAARLIEHYLKKYPHLKIGFLVPTRPLVEQQSDYCRKHCLDSKHNHVVVQRLVGEQQAQWEEQSWNHALHSCQIMLGTAAIFLKAFVTDKYMNLSQFSLLVFDECHNAVGNSPMASVMRDGVIPFMGSRGVGSSSALPRILGLTASFVNGSLVNKEKKRKDLEALMTSTIFCPDIESRLSNESFRWIQWRQDERNGRVDNERIKGIIEAHVDITQRNLSPIQIKEIEKVVSRCSHVFDELGSEALFYYVEKVICAQVLAKAGNLEKSGDSQAAIRHAENIKKSIPFLRAEMDELLLRMRSDPAISRASQQSHKLKRLLGLLEDILIGEGKSDSHRGIVFVEQVALVSAMTKQINDHLTDRHSGSSPVVSRRANPGPPQCGAVAGTGYQTQADRQKQLEAFAEGSARILVATAALEEGIDVSDCSFVVRFSTIATTKAHIQGSGRARHPNARIYYFENNPTSERAKESAMLETARDTSLSLSEREIGSRIYSVNVANMNSRHPYPFFEGNINRTSSAKIDGDDGVVNVFNCKQIFNQYCSMTLGKSISPKTELYQFRTGDNRKILSLVRYPTPIGWQEKTEDDYKRFWEGVDTEQVFVSDRAKKKKVSEREEMAFVYTVVVELREKGWLSAHNKPEKKFMFETKRVCSVLNPFECGITLRDKVVQSAMY